MNDVIDFIRGHQRFLVTSHARPDGDSVGSSLAMGQLLTVLGKSVDIVHRDPPPAIYLALPGIEKIQVRQDVATDYDAAILLECNDRERPGLRHLEENFIINIDHHPHNSAFGDLNYLDADAAAVGEVVYLIAKTMGVTITADIANNILAALVSDTGSFQFSGTTERAFRVAAELMAAGAQPTFVAECLYNNNPLAKIKLMGEVLSGIERDDRGGITWLCVSDEIMRATGADRGDTEGLVNFALSVRGVSAAAFFREEGEENYRVSLRSRRDVDVSTVAGSFGGGGHRNAAGCSLSGPLEKVRETVLQRLATVVYGR